MGEIFVEFKKAVLAKRSEFVPLDNAFVLIEGHPASEWGSDCYNRLLRSGIVR
jgi:hypothetical protein